MAEGNCLSPDDKPSRRLLSRSVQASWSFDAGDEEFIAAIRDDEKPGWAELSDVDFLFRCDPVPLAQELLWLIRHEPI